jgi:hypothetical protein
VACVRAGVVEVTPRCRHGVYADDKPGCARCELHQLAYLEISENEAKRLLALHKSGVAGRLKTLEEWDDAVQAHVDTYHADYPQPEELSFQRVLEVIDGSCWANNRDYYLSALLYGNAWAWEELGGRLDLDEPLSDLARFSFASAVYDAVQQLHADREENQ